jgi:hypothetical protein
MRAGLLVWLLYANCVLTGDALAEKILRNDAESSPLEYKKQEIRYDFERL